MMYLPGTLYVQTSATTSSGAASTDYTASVKLNLPPALGESKNWTQTRTANTLGDPVEVRVHIQGVAATW
jgi:hypothetical protein